MKLPSLKVLAGRVGQTLLSKSYGSGSWSLFGTNVSKSAPWNWWQSDMKFEQGRNGVVYSCVQAYAQTVAQIPLRHLQNKPKGGYEQITNSDLARLLKKPNSYQTSSDFLLNEVSSLFYNGNSYAYVLRDIEGRPDSLHLISPGLCQPMVEPETGAIFYSATLHDVVGGETKVMIPQRDLLHIRLFCPSHPLIGETPIAAAAAAILVNDSIGNKQAAFFNNMSRPSGLITTDEKLNEKTLNELRSRWEEMSTGINTGKVPILSWGLKWQPLSLSDKDAQTVDSMKMSVEDIARVFRVPMPIIGSTDNTTYNNVHNLLQFWKSSGLGFVLNHIENAMGDFFGAADNESVDFDMDALLRADLLTRVDALTRGITGGLYAPNEARNKEGLEDVEGGEKPLVQQQMVPVGWTPPEPEPPAAPTVEPDDPEEQEASVDDFYRGLKDTMGLHA